MEPGIITIISEPYTPNANDYMAQVLADTPEVWFKLQSTTTMLNDGSSGATFDGAYDDPPVTLNTGPLTIDEASAKALKIPKSTSSTTPLVTATVPAGGNWNDRGLYNTGTNYAVDDCVYDTNTAGQAKWYVAVDASTNQPLTNTAYWLEIQPSSATYPLSLPTRDKWTLECWLKYDTKMDGFLGEDNWPTLRGNNQAGTAKWTLGWIAGAGGYPAGYRFQIDGFTSLFALCRLNSTTEPIDITGWHHIAVTNSGSSSATNSGTQRLFVDGVLHTERVNGTYTSGLATSSTQQSNLNMSTAFTRHYPGAVGDIKVQSVKSDGGRASDVWIDQLAFYGHELSENRIKRHFDASP